MQVKTMEDSLFFDILGKSQNTKLLELFMEGRTTSFYFSDVAEAINIRRESIKPLLNLYVDLGILKVIKERKERKLYTANLDNFYTKEFLKIYNKILKDRVKISKFKR